VAVEGLRHIFSLICAAGVAGHRLPCVSLSLHKTQKTGSGAIGDPSIVCRRMHFVKPDIESLRLKFASSDPVVGGDYSVSACAFRRVQSKI
jgi:hypothetical protein